jgi:hypothetical protein
MERNHHHGSRFRHFACCNWSIRGYLQGVHDRSIWKSVGGVEWFGHDQLTSWNQWGVLRGGDNYGKIYGFNARAVRAFLPL